jgi:hypothetical protein
VSDEELCVARPRVENNKTLTHSRGRLVPLLEKGAAADVNQPSRVINISSMAGLLTTDPTVTEEGGLSVVGHGAYSCTSCDDPAYTADLVEIKTTEYCLADSVCSVFLFRWSLESSVHPPLPTTGVAVRPTEYLG